MSVSRSGGRGGGVSRAAAEHEHVRARIYIVDRQKQLRSKRAERLIPFCLCVEVSGQAGAPREENECVHCIIALSRSLSPSPSPSRAADQRKHTRPSNLPGSQPQGPLYVLFLRAVQIKPFFLLGMPTCEAQVASI